MFIKNETLIKMTIVTCLTILFIFIFCPAHAETYDLEARIVYTDTGYAEIEFEDGNVFGFNCNNQYIPGDRVIATMDDNNTSSTVDDKVVDVRSDMRGAFWTFIILLTLGGIGTWNYYQSTK